MDGIFMLLLWLLLFLLVTNPGTHGSPHEVATNMLRHLYMHTISLTHHPSIVSIDPHYNPNEGKGNSVISIMTYQAYCMYVTLHCMYVTLHCMYVTLHCMYVTLHACQCTGVYIYEQPLLYMHVSKWCRSCTSTIMHIQVGVQLHACYMHSISSRVCT